LVRQVAEEVVELLVLRVAVRHEDALLDDARELDVVRADREQQRIHLTRADQALQLRELRIERRVRRRVWLEAAVWLQDPALAVRRADLEGEGRAAPGDHP